MGSVGCGVGLGMVCLTERVLLAGFPQYPKLRTIDLSYNSIITIHGFDSLRDLRELKLYHNRIEGLAGLEQCVGCAVVVWGAWRLNLVPNPRRLPYCSCPRLERLWLQDNVIDFIPRSALAKNRYLRELRLNKNSIEHIANLW